MFYDPGAGMVHGAGSHRRVYPYGVAGYIVRETDRQMTLRDLKILYFYRQFSFKFFFFRRQRIAFFLDLLEA